MEDRTGERIVVFWHSAFVQNLIPVSALGVLQMGLTELIECASNVQREIVFVNEKLPDQFALHASSVFDRGISDHADEMLHPALDNSVPHLEAAECIPM